MLYEDMKSRSTATNKWSYVHFLLIHFNEFLKEVSNLSETMWYTSDYWHWWISLVTKKYIAEIYTWNTSLLCAGAVGIIQRSLKFCQSLRMWMTFRIILNWAQGYTFRNCCTIDMVTLTFFSTIGCDDWLIGRKCLIVILT